MYLLKNTVRVLLSAIIIWVIVILSKPITGVNIRYLERILQVMNGSDETTNYYTAKEWAIFCYEWQIVTQSIIKKLNGRDIPITAPK